MIYLLLVVLWLAAGVLVGPEFAAGIGVGVLVGLALAGLRP